MNSPIETRVGWLGPAWGDAGVGWFGRRLVLGLLDRGVNVTLFTGGTIETARAELGESRKLNIVSEPLKWEWNRWYSRNKVVSFVTSFWARAQNYNRLAKSLVDYHRQNPLGLIVQFSQTELLGIEKHLRVLPPLVIFPCVHAKGELRWHTSEYKLSLKAEPVWRYLAANMLLRYRARQQNRAYNAVPAQIGMSNRFNQLVMQDHGISAKRQAVIYQPADSSTIANSLPEKRSDKIRILFVGRISVRKGIDLLVELSHRLCDLGHELAIEVVGGPTMWSDYRPLLKRLNNSVATYSGECDRYHVLEKMRASHIVIVPSYYEPGGIVVAEALGQGCCLVVSDEVGSAEPIDSNVCRRFPAGDAEAFEREVRKLICEIRGNSTAMAHQAWTEAKVKFDEQLAIDRFVHVLSKASMREPIGA